MPISIRLIIADYLPEEKSTTRWQLTQLCLTLLMFFNHAVMTSQTISHKNQEHLNLFEDQRRSLLSNWSIVSRRISKNSRESLHSEKRSSFLCRLSKFEKKLDKSWPEETNRSDGNQSADLFTDQSTVSF